MNMFVTGFRRVETDRHCLMGQFDILLKIKFGLKKEQILKRKKNEHEFLAFILRLLPFTVS